MAKEKYLGMTSLLQFIIVLSINAQEGDIFSGYKGLNWGSSIEYVKSNYTGTLEPCKDDVAGADINKGEYCLKEEAPGKLIEKRTFYFNNGKLFKVDIDFSDDGLSNMAAIKESFLKDFGPRKLKRDTITVTDKDNPLFKMTKYSESYTWSNDTASILLQKYRVKMNDKSKAELKKAMRSMPQYQAMLLEIQLEGGSAEGMEEMLFTTMFGAAEGTNLNASFINNNIAAETSNEDKY